MIKTIIINFGIKEIYKYFLEWFLFKINIRKCDDFKVRDKTA